MNRIFCATQAEAIALCASIHSRMIAENTGYAASVSAGKTVRWCVPRIGLDGGVSKYLVVIKDRCEPVLSQEELSSVVRDVLPSKINIVVEGDSLTAGVGAAADMSYPNQMRKLFPGGDVQYLTNYSHGGDTLLDMIPDGVDIDARFMRDTKSVCVVWAGTNDLYFGASAATAYSRLIQFCGDRRQKGWSVVVVTALPRSNSGTPAGFEAGRVAFNASVVDNWQLFADAIADVAADQRIGVAGRELDTTYFSTDKVHMTAAGYAIVAATVKGAIDTL